LQSRPLRTFWNQSDILGGWKMMRLPELVSRADTSLGSRAYRE